MALPQARDRLLMQPLIRCDSGADGIVRMKETESCSICFSAPCCKYSLQQGVFICNYQPPEAVTGFPNHFIWGRVPQGGIFYENQIQHPRINRNRHACCRCHSIDVYGVSHSHHARLYQAGCFGTASPDCQLCLRPGCRYCGVPDQKPDQTAQHQHRCGGGAV